MLRISRPLASAPSMVAPRGPTRSSTLLRRSAPLLDAKKKTKVEETPKPAPLPAKCPCQSFFPLSSKPAWAPKVLFVGGGNMAAAICLALTNIYPAENIAVSDVNTQLLKAFQDKGHPTFESNRKAADEFQPDFVYLAVKPAYYNDVVESVDKRLKPEAVIVSMVLGITLQRMQEDFRSNKMVRIMPNTNSAVQRGVTIWTIPSVDPDVEILTGKQETALKEQLQTMGYAVKLPHENLVDAATAVAGCGPAYYLLLMEAATDAGVHLGLPRGVAEDLVYSTILGTVLRAESSNMPLPVLKQQVATPAGATIAALYKLEQGGLRTLIADAMWAAFRRTLQVGGKSTAGIGPDRAE